MSKLANLLSISPYDFLMEFSELAITAFVKHDYSCEKLSEKLTAILQTPGTKFNLFWFFDILEDVEWVLQKHSDNTSINCKQIEVFQGNYVYEFFEAGISIGFLKFYHDYGKSNNESLKQVFPITKIIYA